MRALCPGFPAYDLLAIAAWAKIESNYILASVPGAANVWGLPGGFAAASYSTTKSGWTMGFGAEMALRSSRFNPYGNWTLRIEYLYVDLGTVTNTFGTTLVPVPVVGLPPATGTTTYTSTSTVHDQIIRLGVNYRFGGVALAAPVYK